jgi:hypothetical protein
MPATASLSSETDHRKTATRQLINPILLISLLQNGRITKNTNASIYKTITESIPTQRQKSQILTPRLKSLRILYWRVRNHGMRRITEVEE